MLNGNRSTIWYTYLSNVQGCFFSSPASDWFDVDLALALFFLPIDIYVTEIGKI